MNTDRSTLFCDLALAARIERVEVQLIEAASKAAHRRRPEANGFVIPLAGGVASFADDNSPFNKVAGLGFGGVPDPAELDQVEWAFAGNGAPVQVELAHLVDPEFGIVFTERGYRLESFEDVLGLALEDSYEPTTPAGIEIRPSRDDEFDAWLEVVADAVAEPDTQGVPWREEFPRDTYRTAERDAAAAGIARYIALHDGVIAGGAELRISDGIAQLAGAATAPAHRRRGIQSAFLQTRLAAAAAAGCDVAVITTQPGSKSQQNAHRQGFTLLYTRAILVKQP
jgi:GNAT superfamily N-acetyltransferase